MQNVVYATARLVLHYATLVDRVRHLSRELRNILQHQVTQQPLDPSASFKNKLAQAVLNDAH